MRVCPDFDRIRNIDNRIDEIRKKLGEYQKPQKPFIEVLREADHLEASRNVYVDENNINDDLEEAIEEISAKWNLDSSLVKAVVRVESGGNPKAVSFKGALGLMQLMPSTAKEMGVEDPMDPFQNLEGGTKYLAYLLKKYHNDIDLALAAYNAGPSRVDLYGGVPPFEETTKFVGNVKALYERFKKGDG